jgi:hypothetical protein
MLREQIGWCVNGATQIIGREFLEPILSALTKMDCPRSATSIADVTSVRNGPRLAELAQASGICIPEHFLR